MLPLFMLGGSEASEASPQPPAQLSTTSASCRGVSVIARRKGRSEAGVGRADLVAA